MEETKRGRLISDDTVNQRVSIEPRSRRLGRNSKNRQSNRQNADNNHTLNFMSGDVTFSELKLIPGVSPMALKAKELANDMSIFQKIRGSSPLAKSNGTIAYWNVELLSKFISNSGSIVSSRISGLNAEQQSQLKYAIKVARFLALLPYVEY